jgi:hypothetical protein
MTFQSDEDTLVAGHFNTGDVVVFENPTEACPRPKQLHCFEYEDRYVHWSTLCTPAAVSDSHMAALPGSRHCSSLMGS